MCLDALKLYYLMPAEYRDAFDQLVLFPIQACSNLYDMYYAVAMNRKLAEANDVKANKWADKARACFERDSVLTYHYNHVMSGGKWNHIMDQTHIGYRSWNDPKRNIMPKVTFVPEPRIVPAPPVFVEKDGYISIEAEHYTRSANGTSADWVTIPTWDVPCQPSLLCLPQLLRAKICIWNMILKRRRVVKQQLSYVSLRH